MRFPCDTCERLPAETYAEEEAALGAYNLPNDDTSATQAGRHTVARSRQSVRNTG